MKKSILTTVITLLLLLLAGGAGAFDLGVIPIQHHGRVKPFSAFAQETLQFISGKNTWHGQNAVDFFVVNLDHSLAFLDIPIIRVDHPGLKKLLQLPQEKNVFSYKQLHPFIHSLEILVQNAAEKRNADNRPSALEQQAEIVYQRMITVQHLSTGNLMTVVPVMEGVWSSPYSGSGPQTDEFKQLIRDCAVKLPACKSELTHWVFYVESFLTKGASAKIKFETLYYSLQPFYGAWIFYLTSFFCLILNKPWSVNLGKLLVLAGFAAHSGGILLRWLILDRPPVANMYETMIFMDWVLMVTVGFFVVLKKRQALLSCGALVSALVMLYARLLPVDQSLDVLSPVLRSSYWLTVHVITIISSYSLFAFAMAVSHRHLFLSVQGKMSASDDQISAHTINRLLQAGQIALGAGTVLGGVWANEAWGRFWNWDPKETWAFITFLGYMTILHLRSSNKLNNFALAVGGILGFLLVVMTWYGVNFVSGRGMHSYGSGSGGLIWIVFYLVFETLFLGFVLLRKRS